VGTVGAADQGECVRLSAGLNNGAVRANNQTVSLDARVSTRAALVRTAIAVILLLAWLWILSDPVQAGVYAASWGMLALAGALEAVRVRRAWQGPAAALAVAFVFLAAVGLLRQAGGGFASGVGILALIPVLQSALYGGDRRELWAVLAAVAGLYLAPILILGPPGYPHSQYRAGVLTIAISWLIGLSAQQLVLRVRSEADQALRSRTMVEEVNRLAHELFASADVRTDLSWGALRIADASMAVLYEPDPVAGTLRTSAIAGIPVETLEVAIDADNPIGAAYVTGIPRLLHHGSPSEVDMPEMWRAAASADTVLCQPLLRGGSAVGVLAVAWHAGYEVAGARASVIELLAHEAALVLGRADQVTQLTGMAETDPLTGLPNRRAWDARLARAVADDEAVTVAILDIDHFKRFNDSHGHQAGDRLLRDTALAWRDQLRGDDLLARLGGEEFGLLLVGCDPEAALDVTERLRDAITDQQTCSAGIAVRRAGEPFDSVIGRADHALYDAKAAGRDLALSAV
jgi:diguanylate cyclase (GGDEF)-like protein